MIIFDRSIRSIEHSEGEDGPCNEAILFCRCLAFVPLVASLLYYCTRESSLAIHAVSCSRMFLLNNLKSLFFSVLAASASRSTALRIIGLPICSFLRASLTLNSFKLSFCFCTFLAYSSSSFRRLSNCIACLRAFTLARTNCRVKAANTPNMQRGSCLPNGNDHGA